MKWKKWDFEVGKEYALSDVIGACDARIREGGHQSAMPFTQSRDRYCNVNRGSV